MEYPGNVLCTGRILGSEPFHHPQHVEYGRSSFLVTVRIANMAVDVEVPPFTTEVIIKRGHRRNVEQGCIRTFFFVSFSVQRLIADNAIPV